MRAHHRKCPCISCSASLPQSDLPTSQPPHSFCDSALHAQSRRAPSYDNSCYLSHFTPTHPILELQLYPFPYTPTSNHFYLFCQTFFREAFRSPNPPIYLHWYKMESKDGDREAREASANAPPAAGRQAAPSPGEKRRHEHIDDEYEEERSSRRIRLSRNDEELRESSEVCATNTPLTSATD